MRKRLSIPIYIENAFDIVRQWSHRRDPENVNFVSCASKSSILREDYERAYNFNRESRPMKLVRQIDCVHYFFKSSHFDKDFGESTKQFMRQNFTDFDDFVGVNFGIIKTSIAKSNNYEHSICTCTSFFKKHKCKHIIGLLARKDLYPKGSLTIPQDAKNIAIGQKRGPGRPALAKLALIRQPNLTTDPVMPVPVLVQVPAVAVQVPTVAVQVPVVEEAVSILAPKKRGRAAGQATKPAKKSCPAQPEPPVRRVTRSTTKQS